MLPLAAVFAWLGFWQLERMEEKRALLVEFESAEVMPLDAAIQSDRRFVRISATGRFDSEKHVLLDNQVLDGRAGVHVLTPFRTFSGTSVLVNRGWKPLPADRGNLPDIWTPTVPVELGGTLAPSPEHRQRLGQADRLTADQWPQLVTYLDIASVADALNVALPDRVVWLSAQHEAGFEGRNWSPSVSGPERHSAYAFQWFALSVTAVVVWLVLLGRRLSRPGEEHHS